MNSFYLVFGTICLSAMLSMQPFALSTAQDANGNGESRLHRSASKNVRVDKVVVDNCHLRSIDEAKLASEYSGLLISSVEPGTRVKAGEVVVQLDDALAKARLAVAAKEAASDVEIRFATKALQFAQLKYERAMSAEATLSGTITDIELKELRLAAEKALLQLEQAQNQHELARLRQLEFEAAVRQKQIIAPFDGFVRAVHKRPGEVVNEGETILELVNTDRLRIEGHIRLDELALAQIGANAVVKIEPVDKGDQPRTVYGKVVFVDINVEPVSQKAKIGIEVPNGDGTLRDGMLASFGILRSTSLK